MNLVNRQDADSARAMEAHGEALYDALEAAGLDNDVVLDTSDRSMGVKLAEAALVGYPWCVVVGRRGDGDTIEVKRRCAQSETGHEKSAHMTIAQLVDEIERVTSDMNGGSASAN